MLTQAYICNTHNHAQLANAKSKSILIRFCEFDYLFVPMKQKNMLKSANALNTKAPIHTANTPFAFLR